MNNPSKILLIEDDSEQIDLITLLSSHYDCQIKVGKSIDDFQSLIEKNDFELIICDLNLQYQLEGLDILKSYKQNKLTAKIYAYTSYSAEDTFFLEQGFHGVIKKNFTELRELFNQLLVNIKPCPITNTICA